MCFSPETFLVSPVTATCLRAAGLIGVTFPLPCLVRVLGDQVQFGQNSEFQISREPYVVIFALRGVFFHFDKVQQHTLTGDNTT